MCQCHIAYPAPTLAPLITLIRVHVMAAERIHGDDTSVPVLAKGKTIAGRLWTYVRDDQPFAGPALPASTANASSSFTSDRSCHVVSSMPLNRLNGGHPASPRDDR